MHWRDFNTKSFRWFSAIKNTYSLALLGPKHKIFSAICIDQEYSWICNGGTLTQNLFGDFQLSRKLFDMHWWDLNTKSFRRFGAINKVIDMHWRDFNTKSFRHFSAIKNTYWHALVGPEHKSFSTAFSYQEYLFTCIGGTWTQSLFGDFQLSRILIDMHWRDFNTKSFRWFSGYQENLLTCIGGTLIQGLFGDFQLSRILIDMHCRGFNTKSFRWFSAIKTTYSHALMEPKHKIFSAICSDQEYLWICIGRTLTQRFSVIFSHQEYLFTCIGGTWTQSLFGDFQLSKILIDMHWWYLNTKSFRWFSAIKKTYWHALAGL